VRDIDPNKNCHEYCRFAKCCRYAKGENGLDPEECGWAYKIEDLLNEAKDIREEQEKAFGEDEDDW